MLTNDAVTARKPYRRLRQLWPQIWHLVQMVLAMEVGMLVYHLLRELLPAGSSFGALLAAAPLVDHWLMIAAMTVPMVALMRGYHRSSWRVCADMTLVMLVPPAILTGLVVWQLIPLSVLQMLGDPLMILAMAVVVFRPGGEHHHASGDHGAAHHHEHAADPRRA